ncbi:MAG: hypothetical protein RLZZ444_4687, partial [Pseudomonadota bacterium]
IYGKGSADSLTGNGGADQFLFKSIADSTAGFTGRDTITDFRAGQNDIINLAAIDANSRKAADQDFTFIGTQGFHDKAGELRFEKANGDTFVYGDTNGDGAADFSIRLEGAFNLVRTDFDL